MTASVALFVHARPEHTRQTLLALAANSQASATDVRVFADGPRNEAEVPLVAATRRIVESATGFRDIQLVSRSTNMGLAANIADGITMICSAHGRVIVLEDDIFTSPHFLTFMNEALDRYKDDPRVWHINGWNYPMDIQGLPPVFLWRLMHCWGWATWQDRWQHFEKAPSTLLNTWNKADIHRFNLDGAQDFWGQVVANHRGNMNTWAVFWYATLFQQGGLCISPAQALTANTGLDGSGSHCNASTAFRGELTEQTHWDWPESIVEHTLAIERAKNFMTQIKGSTIRRIMRSIYQGLRSHGSRR